jgi:hypothetical protein
MDTDPSGDILSLVRHLLWELHGDRPERVSLESDLFADLGIDGDDAAEVFQAIKERFEVDFSTMEWTRHFGPEAGFCPLALLFPSWWRWHRNRVPVRVRDLVSSIQNKVWTLKYPPS